MFRYYSIQTFIRIFLIFSYLIFPLERLLGKFFKRAEDESSFRIVQWSFKMVLKLSGVTATVIGKENVPDGPVLFVSNHRSFFDVPLTYVLCKNITGYVAKIEMEHVPSLSTWMRFTHCLFLDRSSPREGLKTILKAIEQVKAGISIYIFPEGRRNTGDEATMLPFKNGAFKIATKSGCPIIPVAINNSFAIYERQAPRVKKTHVVIEYGKPIYPKKQDKEARKNIGNQVRKILQEMIAKNAGLV